jgi:tRNA pseudouridine38-40 synthase
VRLFDLSGGDGVAGTSESGDAIEAAQHGPLRRVMLLVAYDGAAFHGVAAQPGQATVAGVLESALARMAGHPVRIVCAGRTDAGVHALGQVLHADLDGAFVDGFVEPMEDLARSLSAQAGPACAVNGVWVAPEGFDARHSAVSRRYRYRLLPGSVEDPLRRGVVWQTGSPLDLRPMRLAADAVLGEHDFSAFCKRPPGHSGPLPRRVLAASLHPCGDELGFLIEANAFCHHMVRSIVGALVSVGEGRLTPADVVEILRSGDRARGSRKAPPGGLCLMEVRYPEDLVPGGVLRPGG